MKMPNRSINTMPKNTNPKDSFYLVGGNDQDYALFASRIIDVITQKYNPNSGWQNIDGSTGDFNAELNSRYYVESDAQPFSFILPDGEFGDTFTLYSETPNVFVRDSALNVITDVIPLSVLHLLYNGTTWVNFSTQAGTGIGLVANRGLVTSSGFTTFGQGTVIGIEVNRAIITAVNFVRYLPGTSVQNVIVRANITQRPKPPQKIGRFMNLWVHRGVVTARNNQSYKTGRDASGQINRGTM